MRISVVVAALAAFGGCKGGGDKSSENRTASGSGSASAKPAPPPPAPPPAPAVPLAADPGGATGKVRWAASFGGLGTDYARAVAVGASGDVAVAGYFDADATFGKLGVRKVTPPADARTNPKAKPTSDVFVAGLDKSGAPTWVQTFGGPRDDVANGVAVGKDGTTVVAGNFLDEVAVTSTDGKIHLAAKAAGSDDLFAAAFDRTGKPLWLWTSGGIDSDGANAVVATPDGGWLVGGSFTGEAKFGDTTYTSQGGTDALLVKLAPTGDVQWAQQMGGAYNDSINALAVDPRGNIYLLAEFVDTAKFGGAPLPNQGDAYADLAVAKLDPNGKHVWSKSFGSKSAEAAGGIAADPAGNVTVNGSFEGTLMLDGQSYGTVGQYDMVVARFDANGGTQWVKTWGGDGTDIAAGIAADASGNTVLTGWFEGSVVFGDKVVSTHGNRDIVVVKIDPKGAITWIDTFGDHDHDQGRAIALDADGNPVVAGVYRYKFDAIDPPLESMRTPDQKLPMTDVLVVGLAR